MYLKRICTRRETASAASWKIYNVITRPIRQAAYEYNIYVRDEYAVGVYNLQPCLENDLLRV